MYIFQAVESRSASSSVEKTTSGFCYSGDVYEEAICADIERFAASAAMAKARVKSSNM